MMAMLTISMTIVISLPSFDSKVNALTNVQNNDFSIAIPDN
jgi:hypothetical protein